MIVACVWFGVLKTSNNQTISIGVISPLSGGAAAYGEALKNGFEVAVTEINENGGIDGKTLSVVYEDSKCNAKDALTATQKLININQIQYLFGAVCSSEVLGSLPVTEENKIPFFGQGSSPEITGKGTYFLRTWPSDTLISDDLAKYIAPRYKRIAVITEQTDYSLALSKSFSENLAKQGSTILKEEVFNNTKSDFRAQILKIKEVNPDVLFINPQTGQNGALIAKQARELGITAQFIAVYFTGDEYVKSGNAVNGTIIVDFPILDTTRTSAAAFAKKYKDQYGESFNYPFVAAQAYDQLYLLKLSVEQTSEKPEDVVSYLKSMGTYHGTIGDYTFDNNGDVEGIQFTFKKVEGNQLVSL